MSFCFAKSVPKTPLYLDGRGILFDTLDGVTGYWKTNSEAMAKAIAVLIHEGRGGVRKIDEAAYETEFAKKKGTLKSPSESWREELRAGAVLDTVIKPSAKPIVESPPQAAVADAGSPEPWPPMEGDGAGAAVRLPPPPPFKPNIGKRLKEKES